MKKTDFTQFNERLRQERLSRSLSLREAARLINVNYSTLKRLEDGDRGAGKSIVSRIVSGYKIKKINDYLRAEVLTDSA